MQIQTNQKQRELKDHGTFAFPVNVIPQIVQSIVFFPEIHRIQICQHNVPIPVNYRGDNPAVHLPHTALRMSCPEAGLFYTPFCCLLKILLQFCTVPAIPDLVPDHILPKCMRFDDRDRPIPRRFYFKQSYNKILNPIHFFTSL